MDAKTTTVAFPATARKGFGRDANWTVTVLDGVVAGHGATLTQARSNAATTAADIIRSLTGNPAFALDDDGGLVIAVPSGTGSAVYKVHAGRARLIASHMYPPEQALAGAHHYTPIPHC